MKRINQITLPAVASLFFFFVGELKSAEKTNEEFVYLCNKPGQKCYYIIPCETLRETCNKANGKLFKVPLSRAIQMKRTECSCENGWAKIYWFSESTGLTLLTPEPNLNLNEISWVLIFKEDNPTSTGVS